MSPYYAASNMKKLLLTLRYATFGLFIVCNAIICSVSVWNRSIGQYLSSQDLQVDAYLIFLGASALAFIFPIIFIDLARRNPVTSRVWFECAWVGVYWIMELAGAAALASVMPDQMCSNSVTFTGACASTHVLLAFTWIAAISLLTYLVALAVSALWHQKRDPQIWHCAVRFFPWCDSRQALGSTPGTPILPRFVKLAPVATAAAPPAIAAPKPPVIAAPKPRKAEPAPLLVHRAGLRPEYHIEHYKPQPPTAPEAPPVERPVPPIPAAAPAPHVRQSTREATSSAPAPPPSLYPLHMQSAMVSHPQWPNAQALPAPAPPQQQRQQQQQEEEEEQQPLGDWPRMDAVSRPPRGRRQRSTREANTRAAAPPVTYPATAASASRRPSGPRTSSELTRPRPLDLSNISNHR